MVRCRSYVQTGLVFPTANRVPTDSVAEGGNTRCRNLRLLMLDPGGLDAYAERAVGKP
jgi:hypothetical protein